MYCPAYHESASYETSNIELKRIRLQFSSLCAEKATNTQMATKE